MAEPHSFTDDLTPEPVELGHGGVLAITEHDGAYVLHITDGGSTFTRCLTAGDMKGIRDLTGQHVYALAQVAVRERSEREFVRMLDALPTAEPTGPFAQTCTCGHPLRRHHAHQSLSPFTRRVCTVDGCPCTDYKDAAASADEEGRAA